LGLLSGYSVSHQVEFEIAANRQRQLVEQLMALHPAMDPLDTFVIYRPESSQRNLLAIDEEPHGYYFLLKSMFVWPGPIWPPPGPAIRVVHDRNWENSVTVDAVGNVSWPLGVWPPTPEKAGHLWYYEQLASGTLQPHTAALTFGGKNILQSSSDMGVVPLSILRREPFYTEIAVPLPHGSSSGQIQEASTLDPGRPNIDSVSPASGSGLRQVFVTRLSDTRGTNDLSGVYVMFQPSVQPAHSCWLYYDLGSRSFNLAQDNGSSWKTPAKLGSGLLSNSQCSVFGLGANVEVKGSEIEVTAPVEFKHEFSGAKKIYIWVRTVNNIDSGWREAGSWVVP
jgi:hypothetical protein